MFDNRIIVEDGFRNVTEDSDRPTGFQLRTRIPYYRGLALSMIEDIAVSVDGKKIDRDRVRVTLRDRTFTLDEMENNTEERWEFGEVGVVTVEKPGGLAPGKHEIEVTDRLRISYLPFPLVGKDKKVLELSM
jgi:hypothetical protein